MKHIALTAIAMVAATGIAVAQTAPPSGAPTTPRTPPAGAPGTMKPATASAAKAQIEASGYTDVKNLKRNEDGSWSARAMKNSVEVAIMVDGTGNVTQMSR